MRRRLAKRFLGIDDGEGLDFHVETAEGVEVKHMAYDGRRVILTRALSRDVSEAYQEEVAIRVREIL